MQILIPQTIYINRFVSIGLVLSCLVLPFHFTRAEPPVKPIEAKSAWAIKRGTAPDWAPLPEINLVAGKVPTEWLEEHGAIFLHNATRLRLATDGSITINSTQIIRLLGRKAIATLGDHKEILFDPSYQSCTLNNAFVVAPDGQRRELEARHCQVRDMSTDYSVYQNEKQAILSFPGLQVGDTLVVQWTTSGKNPEYKGECFGRFSLGMVGYPTLEEVVQLGAPSGKPFKARAKGIQVEPKRQSLDGTDWITWQPGKLQPLEVEDAQSADLRELEPEVSFSTFKDWAAVGAWQNSLRPDLWTVTPTISALVDQILGQGGNSLPSKAKAALLSHWVKRNIRYLSMGVGHNFTPHGPTDVLANRHGDCKDTAQLLALMLNHAGISADLASLGVKGDGQVDESIPSPWATHALVMATIPEKTGDQIVQKTWWIDTTQDLSGWDQLNEMDQNRICYLVGPKGDCRLVRSPIAKPNDCTWTASNKLLIRADGSATLTRSITAKGEAAVAYRDAFLEEPPVRRKRYIEDQIQDMASQVEVKSFTLDPSSLKDFDGPLKFECVIELKGLYTPPESPEEMVAIPLTDHLGWDSWLGRKIRFPSGEKPFSQGQPFQVDSSFEVIAEKGVQINELPEESKLVTAWGSLSRTVRSEASGQKFMLRFRATRLPAEIQGQDRSQYLEFLDSARDLWQAVLPIQVLKPVRP